MKIKIKKYICVIFVILALLSVSWFFSNHEEPELVNIRRICELATLKCEFHNVVKLPEQTILEIFDPEKVWIEYDGYVKIGIDMNRVEMSIKGRQITITIPEAEISKWDFYPGSVKTYAKSKMIENRVTATEALDALIMDQENMIKSFEKNNELLLEAQERAKELIEYYIKQIGEATGKRYKIIWE